MIRYNRTVFFNSVRLKLFSTLTQEQVDGLSFLLDQFEIHSAQWKRTGHKAYALATTAHETAFSFQPIEEAYYLGSRAKAVQKTFRYYPYFGRGFVQLTWKSNYTKATTELRRQMPRLISDFEEKTGKIFNLTLYPEQALDPHIAFGVMTLGMNQGWFRKGHRLETYINATNSNYYAAREIINGDKTKVEKGQTVSIGRRIARTASLFEACLRLAEVEDSSALLPAPSEITDADASAAVPATDTPPATENDATDAANANDAASTPEPKTVEPPPSDGTSEQTKTVSILGVAVPSAGVILTGAVQWINDGVVDLKEIIIAISSNFKYVLLLSGIVIVFFGLKKLYMQITLWLEMYFKASKNYNDVEVQKNSHSQ